MGEDSRERAEELVPDWEDGEVLEGSMSIEEAKDRGLLDDPDEETEGFISVYAED
jgi:hypothetical protein